MVTSKYDLNVKGFVNRILSNLEENRILSALRDTLLPKLLSGEMRIIDAEKYVGKSVTWTSPAKKVIKGKISAPHGNKGVVRAIFEKGLPGQSIGTKVDIKGIKGEKK